MAAFELLANLVQTIHDPPRTYVLWSHVQSDSWQLRLFSISSDIRCLVSVKREEISRDRKLVAGDKEGNFKDWQRLAKFISEKIVKGDLHVAGWATSQVDLIIDPGRPSSLTVPMSPLPASEAGLTITDFIYLIANDARQHRACRLLPSQAEPPLEASTSLRHGPNLPTPGAPVDSTESETKLKNKLEEAQHALEETRQALRREQEKPKAEGSRAPVAPPKVVPGDSRAQPGQRHRVIKRAEFEDDEDEGHRTTTSNAPPLSKRSKPLLTSKPRRVVTRAEFDDSEDEGVMPTDNTPHDSHHHASTKMSAPSKVKTVTTKRAIKRAEFDDSDEETAGNTKKRKKL